MRGSVDIDHDGDVSKETLLNAAVLHWMHELAAQGIVTTDGDLNVVEWNHWMEEHTGNVRMSNR